MIDEQNNDIIKVAEKLYYEINPNTKIDVPSIAYRMVENWAKEWKQSDQMISLYDWIKINKNDK